MNVSFLYLLAVILVTRLPWVFSDKGASPKALVFATATRLACLCVFDWNGDLLFLALTVIVLSVFVGRTESGRTESDRGEQPTRLYEARIFMLALWLLILGFFCSEGFSISLNSGFRRWVVEGSRYHVFLSGLSAVDHVSLLAYLVGALLAVAESHVMVRYVLEKFGIKPDKGNNVGEEQDICDRSEYNRGRIIGCLERSIAFAFILQGAFTALVFVVAVKNLTRFKQLDKRPFAEYFLIGTLFSLLCSGAAAGAVLTLLAW